MSDKVEISYSRNPVSMSETGKVPHQRHRTRIVRIFTDLRASVSSVQSVFHRNSPQRTQSITTKIFASFALFAVRDISYRTGLFDITSAHVSAFIRVHPRLIFYREMRERGELAG